MMLCVLALSLTLLIAAHHPIHHTHHTHHHHIRPIFSISSPLSVIIFCIRSCAALCCSTSLVTTAAIASTFLSEGALFISATSLSNSASCSFHLDIIFPMSIPIMFPISLPIIPIQQSVCSFV